MKDLNKIMPSIPGMKWGAVTNLNPTIANLKMLNRSLKHDGLWHSVIQGDHAVHVDGVPIMRKKMESMT